AELPRRAILFGVQGQRVVIALLAAYVLGEPERRAEGPIGIAHLVGGDDDFLGGLCFGGRGHGEPHGHGEDCHPVLPVVHDALTRVSKHRPRASGPRGWPAAAPPAW